MLAGRAAELELALAHVGQAHPVLIGGEAGVGKTALLEACVATLEADGFECVRVVGVAGAREFPLAALAHLLPAEPGQLAPGTDTLVALAARAVARLTAAPGSGTVLVLDDAQHLDDLSLQVVTAARATGRVRVIATARTTETLPDSVRALGVSPGVRLELQRLSRRETAEAVAAIVGGLVDEATCERIHQATDGLPLAVSELVRAAVHRGALQRQHGLWVWNPAVAVDAHLGRLLGYAVDDLGPAERHALDLLCIAEHLPIDLVRAIASTADLYAMEAARVVRASPRLGWVVPGHPLLRDAALQAVTPLRLQALAAELVPHLLRSAERDAELERRAVVLACRFEVPIDPDRVVRWAQWARGRGVGRWMPEVAARAWSERPSALTGLAHGDALVQLACFSEADAVFAAAAGYDADPGVQVLLALSHGALLRHELLRPDEADALLAHSRELSESAALQLDLDAVAVNDLARAGEMAPAIALWRSTITSPRTGETDGGLYRLTWPAVIALTLGGHVAEGEHAHLVSRSLRESSGHRHPLVASMAEVWWCITATLAGAAGRVRPLVRRRYDKAVATSNSLLHPIWALPYAMDLMLQADLDGAERVAYEAMQVPPGLDEVRVLARYLMMRIRYLQGRPVEALAFSDEVEQGGAPTFQAHATWLVAARLQAAALDGDAQARRALLEAADTTLRLGQVVPAAYLYFDAMVADVSLECAAILATMAADSDAPVVQVVARFAAARAARDPQASLTVATAAEADGLRAFAVAAARDAVRLAGRGAAAAVAQETLSSLLTRSTGLADPSPTAASMLGLSPRELEVARAAARGRTDKEIAEAFVVSVRTVNAQLRSVYAKLGVDGRKALRDVPGLLE